MKIENDWDLEDMRIHLDEFYELYKNRPIRDNDGGMKSPHMFPSWYIIKKLKPKFIIESGVWKGLGTWFFEKASPESQIICLDPNPFYRIYTSNKAIYSTTDFSQIQWEKSVDVNLTLVFIDDHQNSLDRVKQCQNFGFTKVIFEDNYPFDQGDCYSLKKILSGKDYCIDNAGSRMYFPAIKDDKEFLEGVIDSYQEMPPLLRQTFTRWKNIWDYDTPDPIFDNMNEISKYVEFQNEVLDYTWICYVELKKKRKIKDEYIEICTG